MLERVMIISGESSGELYGSLLARFLRLRNPNIKIIGVGGSRMQSEGIELISAISGAFGLTEAFRAYKDLKQTFNKVVASLSNFKPQVLILIDFPDFNFRVAEKARGLNIKILYYVSPQIWAWRSSRVKNIKRLVDKMALILPFEEDIYRKTDIPHEFVGHPALDEIAAIVNEAGYSIKEVGSSGLKDKTRKSLGINPEGRLIALLPGSRRHEITKLLPVMIDVVSALSQGNTDYRYIIPIAPNLEKGLLTLFNSLKDRFKNCHILTGESIRALLASDIAVIASGTATLQAALLGVPMTVVYKLSPLSYTIGKQIVKVKHISLVNLLADKSIDDSSHFRVREMLQKDVCKDNIVNEINRLIYDKDYISEMMSMFDKIRGLFIHKCASLRVAELVENLHES